MRGQHSAWCIVAAKQIFVKGKNQGNGTQELKKDLCPSSSQELGQVPSQLHQVVGKNVPVDGECPAALLSAIDHYVL